MTTVDRWAWTDDMRRLVDDLDGVFGYASAWTDVVQPDLVVVEVRRHDGDTGGYWRCAVPLAADLLERSAGDWLPVLHHYLGGAFEQALYGR